MKYKNHEFAGIFPMMEGEVLGALEMDIKKHGLRFPVVLCGGAVLDGRNRVLACERAGVEVRVEEYGGDDPLGYVISANLHRRHLNESQRAMVAAKLANKPQGARTDIKHSADLRKVSQPEAAGLLNVSVRTLQAAKAVMKEAPKKVVEIERGEKTVTQVQREIREEKREKVRCDNARKVSAVPAVVKTAAGMFSAILVDPPWDWGDEGDVNQMGRAKPDYATMSMGQLRALPVGKMASPDCHLYLWITNRSLPKGFELLEAWGFRYVTCLTWPKPSFGMGNYFRGQTEQVLFGIKGSLGLKRKDASTLLPAWKRGSGHSAKPLEFHGFIESCSPGPYLEMFGRREVSGWKLWGEDSV
jgi:N6-adenosine-specific RNA methylase IME4